MAIKIGVIGSESSLDKIRDIQPYLQDTCELTFIPISATEEVVQTYQENKALFHSIVFGGALGIREVMEQAYPEKTTPPYYFIEFSDSDFYRGLLKFMSKNNQLDLSRVLIDFLEPQNNYYGLKDIFARESFPLTCEQFSFAHQFNEIIEHHISLWKNGLSDLSITHVGSIATRLQTEGIPVIFMYPSAESIIEQLNRIITETQLINLQENQSCFGYIAIDKRELEASKEEYQHLLDDSLAEFKQTHPIGMIQKHNGIEVIISYGELKELTQNFKACLLQNHFKDTLSFKVNIGWGIGIDLHQAQLNAQKAIKEAEHNWAGNSFLVTAENKVIGPLGSDVIHSFTSEIDPDLEAKGKELGITPLQIKKIIATIQKRHSEELTSDILAYHLGVTIRTANRILNKLEEKGIAKVAYMNQEKLRGRPRKVYTLQTTLLHS